ncbi:hypothetical protein [Acidiluteibacter ferrifornacis]|uniref:Uncharacterized protein n=1 Tax=Acidiluteibacter ferrifornacis TaxID=2692424 RepID=A0A6N9NNE0_9FLAO|nr:hypothetical protein [Acidiluteibacter ferrifornacis]NBG67414.1 hypothetical protein [Acidiluteibacter ferrifornacis]
MKTLLKLFILLFFISSSKTDIKQNKNIIVYDSSDTINSSQNLSLDSLKENTEKTIFDYIFSQFDASEFLDVMNFENSGIGNTNYLLKPDTSGFFYSYFVFKSEDKSQVTMSIDEMRVTTYKYGNIVGNYNSNETFRELICKTKDSRLKNLNFVGSKRTDFDIYRNYKSQTDSTIFYHNHPTFLLLKFDVDTVKWFKFGYINKELNQTQKADLLKYKL